MTALGAGKDPATLMTTRGPRIFADDFSRDSIATNWRIVVGKWLVKQDALSAENPTEQDHSTIRRDISEANVVFQFDFRLGGATALHFTVNDAQDHVVRVMLSPDGMQLRKDGSKTDTSDVAKILDRSSMRFDPATRYTLLVEILGTEAVARIDETHVVSGSDPKIDRVKGSFGFATSGNGILIDNVQAWRATANPEWTATKAKLQARKSEKAQSHDAPGRRP